MSRRRSRVHRRAGRGGRDGPDRPGVGGLARVSRPGALFVAVKGERADGYDFAAAAVAAGAAAVLADRPVPGVPTVVVPDVVRALGRVAHAWRRPAARVRPADRRRGHRLLRQDHDQGPAACGARRGGSHRGPAGVVQQRARAAADRALRAGRDPVPGPGDGGPRPGHIADLTRIARPDVAVVLNVGSAHVGEFGSRERTAQAKGELVEALAPDGVAVLSADDPLVRGDGLAQHARRWSGSAPPTPRRCGPQDVRLVDGRRALPAGARGTRGPTSRCAWSARTRWQRAGGGRRRAARRARRG